MATPTSENDAAEKIVRQALDEALRMHGPTRRSFFGGFLAAIGLGAFAVGDGLPHGGIIRTPPGRVAWPRVGERGAEMVLPRSMTRKLKLGVKDGWQTAEAVGPITITVTG